MHIIINSLLTVIGLEFVVGFWGFSFLFFQLRLINCYTQIQIQNLEEGKMKERGKEGGKEGRKEGRKEGMKEERNEGDEGRKVERDDFGTV